MRGIEFFMGEVVLLVIFELLLKSEFLGQNNLFFLFDSKGEENRCYFVCLLNMTAKFKFFRAVVSIVWQKTV